MQRVRVTLEGQLVTETDVDRELLVGRKPPADIVVAHTEVSSRHATLRSAEDGVVVTDLGSTNGTSIDGGAKFAPNTPVTLRKGQKLKMGAAVLEIVEPARPESSSGFASTDATVRIGQAGELGGVLANIGRFKTAKPRLVIAAEHDRRVVPVEGMDVVVGRDGKQAQIVVQHQSVSARHAKIRFENGKFLVEDLKSANGTFLDGGPVVVPTPLAVEQAVTFGTVDCLFVQEEPEAAASAGDVAEALVAHVVGLGRATQQQGRDVLAAHRGTGASLGELFVSKGLLGAKEWSKIHAQREIILTMSRMTGRRGTNWSKLVGIAVIVLGLAALAAFWLKNR